MTPTAGTERDAARRARPERRGLAGVLIVGLLLLSAYLVMQSPVFAIRDIYVSGAVRLGEDDVRRLAGVLPGENSWRIDPEQVARRLRQHPWIGQAEVSRALPSGLRIRISERKPLAVVPYEGFYLALDERGVALSLVDDLMVLGVPVITGAETPVFVAGQVYPVPAVNTAIAAFTGLGEYAADVAEMHVSEPDGLTIWLQGGIRAEVGRSGDLDAKLVMLRTILLDAAVKGQRLASIDVRYQPPVITYRKGE